MAKKARSSLFLLRTLMNMKNPAAQAQMLLTQVSAICFLNRWNNVASPLLNLWIYALFCLSFTLFILFTFSDQKKRRIMYEWVEAVPAMWIKNCTLMIKWLTSEKRAKYMQFRYYFQAVHRRHRTDSTCWTKSLVIIFVSCGLALSARALSLPLS